MNRRVRSGERGIACLLAAAIGLAAAPARADVEAELRAELIGRFALTRSALFSECTDHYTDIDVVGGRMAGGRGERFAAGELARIDNVKIGALAGLVVNLSFVEPYLIAYTDGPFTLYDQHRCRVQLNFDLARDVRRDRERSLAAIDAVLEPFDDESAARAAGWNRREVEPYPEDWEATRAAHERWKVEQRNLAVRGTIEDLLASATRIYDQMSDDEGYLAAFAAGARARSDSWSSCDAMLGATFSVSGGGRGKERNEKAGWSDGQRAAWATRLARALLDCYLAEP